MNQSATDPTKHNIPEEVFICYNRDDLDYVSAFKEKIESAKLSCWIDNEGSATGVDWADEVDKAIEESFFACVFIGKQIGERQKEEIGTLNTLGKMRAAIIMPNGSVDIVPTSLKKPTYADFRNVEKFDDEFFKFICKLYGHRFGKLRSNFLNILKVLNRPDDQLITNLQKIKLPPYNIDKENLLFSIFRILVEADNRPGPPLLDYALWLYQEAEDYKLAEWIQKFAQCCEKNTDIDTLVSEMNLRNQKIDYPYLLVDIQKNQATDKYQVVYWLANREGEGWDDRLDEEIIDDEGKLPQTIVGKIWQILNNVTDDQRKPIDDIQIFVPNNLIDLAVDQWLPEGSKVTLGHLIKVKLRLSDRKNYRFCDYNWKERWTHLQNIRLSEAMITTTLAGIGENIRKIIKDFEIDIFKSCFFINDIINTPPKKKIRDRFITELFIVQGVPIGVWIREDYEEEEILNGAVILNHNDLTSKLPDCIWDLRKDRCRQINKSIALLYDDPNILPGDWNFTYNSD